MVGEGDGTESYVEYMGLNTSLAMIGLTGFPTYGFHGQGNDQGRIIGISTAQKQLRIVSRGNIVQASSLAPPVTSEHDVADKL